MRLPSGKGEEPGLCPGPRHIYETSKEIDASASIPGAGRSAVASQLQDGAGDESALHFVGPTMDAELAVVKPGRRRAARGLGADGIFGAVQRLGLEGQDP